MAISASDACKLPTCLCARPCWLRIKTSHSGHSLLMLLVLCYPAARAFEKFIRCPRRHASNGFTRASSGKLRSPRRRSRDFALCLFLGIGHHALADPGAFVVGFL